MPGRLAEVGTSDIKRADALGLYCNRLSLICSHDPAVAVAGGRLHNVISAHIG